MSATTTPQHVTEAYAKVGGVDRYVSLFGGRHFDDPVQDTADPTPLYQAEVKKPKSQDSDLAELALWLSKQTWSDFAQSLAEFYSSRGYLTEKQAASARSMKAKVEARNAERQAPAATADESGLDLSDLPSGYYGVPGGDTRLKIRVNHVTSGKWEGFTFVDDGAEYGAQQKYGMQRPDGTYKGKVEEQLRKIMADVPGALKAYGDLTGRCGVCNRKLEDETSVALGIGPVCREKMGL